MCRNIRPLFNFEPHATSAEIQDAALQYVRKLTGMNKPSELNEKAFNEAVEQIAHVTSHLFGDLETKADPKNREIEAAKRKAKSLKRFGS